MAGIEMDFPHDEEAPDIIGFGRKRLWFV